MVSSTIVKLYSTIMEQKMEESRLQGKTLYCCFVDFKKAFDTVPRSELWNRMVEIDMSIEY